MTQQESDAISGWIDTLPRPLRNFLILGGCVGGIAMLLFGAMRLVSPPEDAGFIRWLSGVGFVLFGPFLVWQAVKLFRR